ncbi:MAG: PEP-CTERM sorting domain-containing protein [Rariglobus sp.]
MNPASSLTTSGYSFGALALSVLLSLSTSTAARADTVIVDEPFTSSDLTDNIGDPLDAAWTSLSNTALSVGAFNSTGNISNALRIDTTAGFSGTRGQFTNGASLAIGESITVSFDFRIINTAGNDSAGLRFGLSSSSNTYAFTFGTGTTTGGGMAQFGANSVGGTNNIYTASGTPFAINDTASHTFSFKITRTSSISLSFLGSVDGNTISASTTAANSPSVPTTVSNFNFTSIVLGQGGTSNDFNIDNVNVTLEAIPEPSTYAALAGLSALGLVAFQRRRGAR